MANPKISILIPVYNGGEYLKRLIYNLQSQTFKDFEVICVEDGSDDGSKEFLYECAKTDERIKVIIRKTKGGTAIKGITYGIEYCSGDYFFYTSQDDLFDTDFFEKIYNRALETDADITIADMIWYRDDGENKDGIFPPNNDYEQVISSEKAFLLALDWRIHSYYLQKTDFAKKIGWDDIYYNSCEYATRIHLYYAKKIVFVNTKAYYRQDNVNAITKSGIKPFKLETMLTDLRLIDFMIKHNLKKTPEFRMLFKKILNDYKYYYSKKVYESIPKDMRKDADKVLNKVRREYIKQSILSKRADFILRAIKLLMTKRSKFIILTPPHYYFRYKLYQFLKRKKIYLSNKSKKRENFFKLYRKLYNKGIVPFDNEIEYLDKIETAKQLPCSVGRCTYCGNNVVVGSNETTIGSFCSIAANITIGPGEHPLNYMSTSSFFYLDLLGWNNKYREIIIEPCQIGNDVWIGSDVFIRSGVKIGHGAVIAAGAVVVKDVPDYAVVGGVPAKVLKYRFSSDMIKDFLELKWWDLDDDTIRSLPFKNPEECIKRLKEIRNSQIAVKTN